MTEQRRDTDMDVTGSDTTTSSNTGPESERDQSGLGSHEPSGGSGWRGIETDEGEQSSVGQADTGSIGAGAGTGSLAGQLEQGWQGGSEGGSRGDVSGGIGQEQTAGGESFEGRNRDIGTSGWNTGDAGFGSDASDDGGPNAEAADDPTDGSNS